LIGAELGAGVMFKHSSLRFTIILQSRGVQESEHRSRLRQELVFFNRTGAGPGVNI